jgi:hypothetical protein
LKTAASPSTSSFSARTRIVQSGRTVLSENLEEVGSRVNAEPAREQHRSQKSQTRNQQAIIKRFVERNVGHIEAIDPNLKDKSLHEQIDLLQSSLSTDYNGDFVRFFDHLQADERDLRLRTSHQVASAIGPHPIYAPPPSLQMDGYQTARLKHADQIKRVLRSARDPTLGEEAPRYNRTKGSIAGYGNFSEWQKYKQLNATAMLNR